MRVVRAVRARYSTAAIPGELPGAAGSAAAAAAASGACCLKLGEVKMQGQRKHCVH
jgi:hypothetical protein